MAKVTRRFLQAMQSRNARVAVTASATRGAGRAKVKAAREFLGTLPLRRFSVSNRKAFCAQLDAATEELRRALPPDSRSWGLARKLLNIFLRGAFYSRYLCKGYKLHAAERFFEIPRDSITAEQLYRRAGRGVLRRWKGVKYLTQDVSDEYQQYATKVARTSGDARVHLDAYWWGERKA